MAWIGPVVSVLSDLCGDHGMAPRARSLASALLAEPPLIGLIRTDFQKATLLSDCFGPPSVCFERLREFVS